MLGLLRISASALFIAALSGPAAAALVATERQPLWVAVHIPEKQLASASLSRMIELLTDVVRTSTDLRTELVDDAIVQRCTSEEEASLACLIRLVRSDYQQWLESHAGATTQQLNDYLSGSPGRFLVIISAVQRDEVATLLVDTHVALNILHESRSATDQDAEARISREAVALATLPKRVASEAELETFLRHLLTQDFGPKLDEAGLRNKLGEIAVDTPFEDEGWIVFDGTRIGRGRGKVLITDVPPGRHTITVEHEQYEPATLSVDVAVDSSLNVVAAPVMLPSRFATVSRDVLLWSGVAVGVAGVAVASIGIATPQPFEICAGADCDEGKRFTVRGTGHLVPIGYSLVGMGAAWSLGAVLGSEDAVPWIEFAAGLVVFGASYAISIALREDTPCGQRIDCIDEVK